MNKHYVISDLHGQGKLWNQIKEYIDDTDTLYCLGDCVDRGPDGVTIMKEMLERPNTIYIKGNHEDFFCQHAVEGWNGHIDYLWGYNGGGDTAIELQKICKTEEEVRELVKKIQKLPYYHTITDLNGKNIILTHSGWYQGRLNFEWGDDLQQFLWSRDHFFDKWELEDNTYIIHGHTPAARLYKEIVSYTYIFTENDKDKREENQKKLNEFLENWINEPEPVGYCGGHKIDIDLGSFYTKRACLLDLETLEVEEFFSAKE